MIIQFKLRSKQLNHDNAAPIFRYINTAQIYRNLLLKISYLSQIKIIQLLVDRLNFQAIIYSLLKNNESHFIFNEKK